jgi:hypothetical protein
VFFFSLEEGKREKAKQKRKGLGLQEASPTVHTLILKKKEKPTRVKIRLFLSSLRFACLLLR